MKSLEYTVRFNTPAFLGNAEQNAQWRTPPFKALIRQWWRVVCGIKDAARLREEEDRLFGAANDEGGGSQKSQLRLRLDSWASGTLQGAWGRDPQVFHQEVGQNGRNVGAHLYLGYGPLIYQQGTALKHNAAIQAGETNTLRLAWPGRETSLAELVQLIDWFGALGGRSRNGWGSLELLPLPPGEGRGEGTPIAPLAASHPLLGRISRPLDDCLRHDWPHALGQGADGRPLVWQSTQTFVTWREAMQALAKAKIGFRTQPALHFQHGEQQNQTRPADIPFENRHLMAYPVTHHAVAGWAEEFGQGRLKYDRQGWVVQSARLANQLRFKVASNGDGRLVARIFHLPCALPRDLAQSLGRAAPTPHQQAAIWQTVHGWLDNTNQSAFQRI